MLCIICGVFSLLFGGPARYMWFALGSVLFWGELWALLMEIFIYVISVFVVSTFKCSIPKVAPNGPYPTPLLNRDESKANDLS